MQLYADIVGLILLTLGAILLGSFMISVIIHVIKNIGKD
jgi:hypothetical protein